MKGPRHFLQQRFGATRSAQDSRLLQSAEPRLSELAQISARLQHPYHKDNLLISMVRGVIGRKGSRASAAIECLLWLMQWPGSVLLIRRSQGVGRLSGSACGRLKLGPYLPEDPPQN